MPYASVVPPPASSQRTSAPRLTADEPLRILVVATKSPFPPIGGGRVVLHSLLTGLVERGHTVRVLALGKPASVATPSGYSVRTVGTPKRFSPLFAVDLLRGRPATFARYELATLAREADRACVGFQPDIVHVEQCHTTRILSALPPEVPVLLRQENVESLLVHRRSSLARGPLATLLAVEARRVAVEEAAACSQATVVAAISDIDVMRLRELSPAANVELLPASLGEARFPDSPTLPGRPPYVCIGSFDWWPNRDGVQWLLSEVWPRLRELQPASALHLVGPGSERISTNADPRVHRYGTVTDISNFYPKNGVALIPLRAGSGVRMRLLESWAAGVPVVTTPAGGEGLIGDDHRGALVAASAASFAAAAARLSDDEEWRHQLVAAGKRRVEAHRPAVVAARAEQLYREAIAIRACRR